MRILAVDDDEIALDILATALRNTGYDDVTTAHSAQEATKIIGEAETAYDCLLLDIVMPGMDGIELCAALRATELYSHTPIIMITAVRDQCHIDRAFLKGATDYVTKPFIGIELGARIRAAEALASLVRREKELRSNARILERKLASADSIALTDRIELEDTPGAIRFSDLETQLLHLPDGTYAMEVMAFRLLGTAELHKKLSSADFRSLIQSVAKAAATCVENVKLQIAYVGEGCFACVVQSNGARLPSGFGLSARRVIDELSLSFLDGEGLAIEVAMGKTEMTTIWTGREVVAGLHDAIAKVRAVSLRREAEAALATGSDKARSENRWRHGGAVKRLVPELFARAEKLTNGRYRTAPEDRVSPRRVKAQAGARA